MKMTKQCKECTNTISLCADRCKSCAKKQENKMTQKRRLKHKTQLKNYQRNYLLTSNGIYSHLKYNAKRRQIKLCFTKIEFFQWYNSQIQKCYYCSRTIMEIINDSRERQNVKYRLSIDRLDSNKDYSLDNIVLSCCRCNYVKSDYFSAEEMLEIGEILYK